MDPEGKASTDDALSEDETQGGTTDPWAALPNTNVIPSDNQEVTPDNPISIPLIVNQHRNPGDPKGPPVAMAIEATATLENGISGDQTSGSGTDDGTSPNISSNLENRFYIVMHLPEQVKMYNCQLDTASDVDILSQDVVDNLGMKLEPYKDGDIHPLGQPIQPLGQLTLDWHVQTKKKTYTTTFIVLDRQSTRGFDALIGITTLSKIGFYEKNNAVWYLNSKDPGTVC